MKIVFDIDSKLWRFFDYAADLVILNFLFLLTSIPLVTIGASITAMDSVHFKRKEKKIDGVKTEYFRAFKENFKSSTVIWLIFLVFVFLCALNVSFLAGTGMAGGNIILIILGAVLAVLFMTALYSFAMLARFENGWLETAAKAFAISILSFPYTAAAFLAITASVLAGIQSYLSILTAVSIWISFGFSLLGLVCCEMFYRAFRRFTRRDDLPKDTIDEEMYAQRDYYRAQRKRRRHP